MHEFSIAVSIIEIAEAEAQKAKAVKIKELILDIGTMSGIEFYALETAMEMAVKNTLLEIKSRPGLNAPIAPKSLKLIMCMILVHTARVYTTSCYRARNCKSSQL
jgi:Zn finger protein HypA/HybF involved in hydrogenase expression